MKLQEGKCLDVWIPRGLVSSGAEILSAFTSAEGLCALSLSWEGDQITNLQPIQTEPVSSLKMLLPRFAEPHAHIDKAFTWREAPNLNGNYQEALETNLNEQRKRTLQAVYLRAERSLSLAVKNGYRAIRSHVDSFGSCTDQNWEALLDLRSKWNSLIELQLVALVPLEYWSTEQGKDLAVGISAVGGLLGGVLVPPFDRKVSRNLLIQMFKLANQLGCGIDLHIDESQMQPAAGLSLLVQVLDHIELDVPLTCSHSSSMGLLPSRDLRYLAERLARHQVKVVALPLTNAWLLGRKERTTPVQRPIAPISQLQEAGVTVAVGGDNVQDPWFPLGNFDPIALMSLSLPIAQLAPWKRLGLAPFTTSAAAVMNLEWDGIIQIGCPADFVLLDANSWSEALSSPPSREVMINGSWIANRSESKNNLIEFLG